jgi:hypothetical protein
LSDPINFILPEFFWSTFSWCPSPGNHVHASWNAKAVLTAHHKWGCCVAELRTGKTGLESREIQLGAAVIRVGDSPPDKSVFFLQQFPEGKNLGIR